MSFSNSQNEAILHKDGPMLVLAGPGSGKTTVITQRTKKLIESGVDPSHILVITFTKAAATEMKERFQKLMSNSKYESAAHRVTFGTFHAVFFMVLKYAYRFESSNIIREEQKYNFIKEIIARHSLDIKDENEFASDILSEISLIKNSQIPLETYYSSHCGEELFREIYREYESRLRRGRLIDFDDMLVYTYELFDQRKDILGAWQKKYQYILVDEFQDINKLQYSIVQMLALPENNLFIVGDDDQSIYRFRGSKPEIMLHFPEDYKMSSQVALSENYRSQKCIVEASKRLIGHNTKRFQKDLSATIPEGKPVRYLTFKNQREQNLFLIREIDKLIKENVPINQIAVLFRTNMQPRLLMEQLLEYNVPFKTRDKIPNLYEHWIAKDLFTYLRIAHGSRKRSDFLQIMNKPKRYIGRDSLCEDTVAFDEWIKMYDEQDWMAERIEKLWHDIIMLQSMRPYAAVNYIRKGIDYDSYITEYAQYRNISADDLFDVLEEIQASAKEHNTFEEWMDHVNAYTLELEEQSEQRKYNPDALVLSTLHSVKGLEFSYVFMVDVNEKIMPYKKAVLEKDIEEERRLFYVGMTRAKQELTICSLTSLRNKEVSPSRFIKECQEQKKDI